MYTGGQQGSEGGEDYYEFETTFTENSGNFGVIHEIKSPLNLK